MRWSQRHLFDDLPFGFDEDFLWPAPGTAGARSPGGAQFVGSRVVVNSCATSPMVKTNDLSPITMKRTLQLHDDLFDARREVQLSRDALMEVRGYHRSVVNKRVGGIVLSNSMVGALQAELYRKACHWLTHAGYPPVLEEVRDAGLCIVFLICVKELCCLCHRRLTSLRWR